MSNIYIQEPPTHGKVLLKTSVGDIDIELWSKEAPKACRNFVQLCQEGYYEGTIFHRVVKGFMVQGGDPTGTGMGGESIYGEPFKDELHSRLRFVRRGLVAMANAGKDDNGSQFFFTFAMTSELQNKHTIFGKIAGPTLYNMLKLEDSLVDQNERPLHPHKIISAEILSNPFPDIVPRELKPKKESVKKEDKFKSHAKKDFKLLSFGDEAEEEEEEVNQVTSDFKGKSKSSHDLLKNDPKLSAIPAVESSTTKRGTASEEGDSDSDHEARERKRKRRGSRFKDKDSQKESQDKDREEITVDLVEDDVDKKRKDAQTKLEDVKNEYKLLKRQMRDERKRIVENITEEKVYENEAVAAFKKQSDQYKQNTNKIAKKGSNREEQALALLAKFKSRLLSQREKAVVIGEDEDQPMGDRDESWMAHEFKCQKEEGPVLAKDANLRGEVGWYDLHDPRNSITMRRSGQAAAGPDAGGSSRKK